MVLLDLSLSLLPTFALQPPHFHLEAEHLLFKAINPVRHSPIQKVFGSQKSVLYPSRTI